MNVKHLKVFFIAKDEISELFFFTIKMEKQMMFFYYGYHYIII